MSTIPLSKTLQARCFRIHNSLDFEQVIWGICWLLQNMSTESGSIPTIKPIGNASSNIFEQLSSQIKTILISCRYKSGFAIKWIMAPNLERKNKQKNDTFAFKAFWIRDCRPLTSLTSPFWHCDFHKLLSRLGFGWAGETVSHHRLLNVSKGLDDLMWQYYLGGYLEKQILK